MIPVSKETLKQTIKCPFDYACLKDQHFPKCVVDYSVENNIVFVKEVRKENCPYLMSFGYATLCHCPTRFEIYQKYEK